tara:strand:+ start:324 stop:740 length:417 start_codon:yes stop_codon:yes gene_type:complete
MLSRIINVLLYFDFQPLLFFWVTSDILNNQVLWTSLSYWQDAGQTYTYWLYFAYLLGSIGMLYSVFTNNKKLLCGFVSYYLILSLFSTVKYLINIYFSDGGDFNIIDAKNIIITCWYTFMWMLISFKLKKENLHKSLL